MTQSFDRLVQIREFKLYQANQEAVSLMQSRELLEKEQEKLAQLITFQQEYYQSNAWGQTGRLNAVFLARFERFLSGLTEAIEQQEKQVKYCQYQVNIQAKKWDLAKHKVLALDKVSDIRNLALLRKENKSQQIELDDRVAHRLAVEMHE